MQKSALILLPVISILFLSQCSHKLYPEGSYQKKTVTTDAELNDWELPLRFGNKAGTIQYTVTNDKENVYIALLSRDEATEQKILKMGMTVYFDPSGGEGKNISINFPTRSSFSTKAEDRKTSSGDGSNVNTRSHKQEMLLQSTEFTISGFQHLENRSYDLNDKHAIQLALKINDDNSLAYEAAVPIKNILGYPLSINDSRRNFSVGIIIKGFQGAGGGGENAGGRGGGYSRPMSGGRGMGGGRMGGARSMGGRGSGMGAAGSPERTNLLKDDVNWYKFRLAGK